MKKIHLAIWLLIIAGVVGVWLVFAPATTVPVEKPRVAASAPVKMNLPPPVVASNRVAMPVVAAVQNPVEAPKPEPAVAVDPADQQFVAEPQADLNMAIATIEHVLENQDLVGLIKTAMPPSAQKQMSDQGVASTPEDMAAQMRQHEPNFDQRMSGMLQAIQTIKTQTPNISADGNTATYPLDVPIDGHKEIKFVKEDGFWYLD